LRLGFYLIFLLNYVIAVAQQNPDLGRFIQPVQPAKSAREIYLNRNLPPDDYQAQIKAIEEWFREGDYQRVARKSEDLLKLDSTLELPLIFAAESYRLMDEVDTSLYYTEKIKRHHPLLAAPYLIDALIAYRAGKLKEMNQQLEEAQKREPESSYLFHYKAIYHAELGQLREARSFARKMLRQTGALDPVALQVNGVLELSKKSPNYKKAYRWLKKSMELNPSDDLLGYLAYCSFELEKHQDCIDYLKALNQKPEKQVGSLGLQALAQLNLGRNDEAFQTLLMADSVLAKVAYFNLKILGLREVFAEIKHLPPSEARAFYISWARILFFNRSDDFDVIAFYLWQKPYCARGKWFIVAAAEHPHSKVKKAMSHLSSAYYCDSTSVFLNAVIADYYTQMNNPDEALFFLQRAIDRGLNYPDIFYVHSLLHLAIGDTTQALANLRKAIDLNKNLPVVWFEYSKLLINHGESEKGTEALQSCIELNPTFSAPYRLLSELLYREGAFNRSLTAIDDAIRREPLAEDYLLRAKLRDTLGFDSNIEEDLREAFNKNADLVELQEFYIRWLADQNRKPEAITLMAQTCNQVLAWEEIMPSCASSDTALEQLEVFIQACGKVDTEAARMADFFWDQHNLLKAGEWFNQSKLRQNKLKAALCFIHEGAVDKARAITDLSFELKPEEKIWLRNIIQLKEKGLNGLERMKCNISMSPHDKVTEQLVQMVFNQLGLSPERADQLNPFK
jgi:tetratricopeptide (TPR) repeat protein